MSFPLSSFDSDEVTCFDVVKALFGLSDNEVEVLASINHNKPIDVKGITKIIKKDRTAIVRSIQRLMDVGAVKKEKVSLERGGYKYLYHTLPIDEFRDKLKELIVKISERMEKGIMELSEEKCSEMYLNVVDKYSKLKI
jgi:predicted transcriptional regulator